MPEHIAEKPPATDLSSIGEILKNKREEHSYTLEHVSEITRITLSCLRNIEDGNLEALPGLVFVRGFVRNYAKLLGLESDWMIEALNQAYETKTSPQSASETDISEKQISEKPANKRIIIVPVVIVIIAAFSAAIYWNFKSADEYTIITKNVETVQAVDQAEITEAVENQALEEITEDVVIVEETEEKPVISPLMLTLVAQKNEWIRLSIDNKDPQNILLMKGSQYDWPAEDEYTLVMTTGDTASIHLNGEEIIEREEYKDQIYKTRLNKFTLTRINNR